MGIFNSKILQKVNLPKSYIFRNVIFEPELEESPEDIRNAREKIYRENFHPIDGSISFTLSNGDKVILRAYVPITTSIENLNARSDNDKIRFRNHKLILL